GEEELLLPLHGVGALVGHVKRVGGQVPIRALERGVEGLAVIAKLLHDPRALGQQPLLEMGKLLLVHEASMGCGSVVGDGAACRRTATRAASPSRCMVSRVDSCPASGPRSRSRVSVSPRMNSAWASTACNSSGGPSTARVIR